MNTIDRSHEFAKKSLNFVIKHGLEANPVNFEVIYSYTQGYNKSLILAVNHIVKSDRPDKSAALAQVHSKLISNDSSSNKVDEITSQMANEVDQVSAMISAALGQSNDYSDALGEAKSVLSETIDSSTVNDIVQSLVSATDDMKNNSHLLESKLAASNRQIFELSESLSDMRTEARTDQLTGIANRKCFDETIASEIEYAIEKDLALCVLLGDIDHFKNFNDTYGHQTGDQVLRLVASCLGENIKGRDIVARYGGEEFAIVLTKTNLMNAEIIANKIRNTVQGKELVKRSTGDNLGSVTICFGAALYRKGENIEDFISRADQSLYLAKHAGRNQVKTELDLPMKKEA
ncbi:MAG: diguanylate cyclase [Rhizobiales bacterium]|nr:diguanylate cyclase [Hyphomicrobiales bacterium]NRB12939.1 diguanylate cyclase [Hyphomicrobiales bacterium]